MDLRETGGGRGRNFEEWKEGGMVAGCVENQKLIIKIKMFLTSQAHYGLQENSISLNLSCQASLTTLPVDV